MILRSIGQMTALSALLAVGSIVGGYAAPAHAHVDIVVAIEDPSGAKQLVAGDGTHFDERVFHGPLDFTAASGGSGAWYSGNDPGFVRVAAPPSGFGLLPSSPGLHARFVPFSIDGGDYRNFMYWDPVEFDPGTESPNFVSVGASYELGVYRNLTQLHTFGGAASEISAASLLNSNPANLHDHWIFTVRDTIPNADAAPGVYLFAMQLQLEGYADSNPFLVMLSADPQGLSFEQYQALSEWTELTHDWLIDAVAEGQVAFMVPEPAGLGLIGLLGMLSLARRRRR